MDLSPLLHVLRHLPSPVLFWSVWHLCVGSTLKAVLRLSDCVSSCCIWALRAGPLLHSSLYPQSYPVHVTLYVLKWSLTCACVLSRVQLFATQWTVATGSSVHGILRAKILEWFAISSSRGSSWPWIEPVSLMSPALAGRFLPLDHLGTPWPELI